MTGGCPRNPVSGLDASINARRPVVKNVLFSTARRFSTSALQLSVLGPSATRSSENVSLTSHGETAFNEHVFSSTNFLAKTMDPTGRLRTASLTMDVPNHKRKDMDSGNSSLIDSNSADSYQEFGCGSRSRTTSSSKSAQSLTSVNQTEYPMGSNRKRCSSIDGSMSGSSGKVSLNTSDITEASEESLTSDKNKDNNIHPSFYPQDDTYLESESQPFLYRPHLNSLRFSHGNGNYIRHPDIQDSGSTDYCEDDNCEYPTNGDSDIFNSTIISTHPDSLTHHVPIVITGRSFKSTKKRSPRTDSFKELQPLLGGFEVSSEKNRRILPEFNHEDFKLPLRRSASLGDLSLIPLNCTVTCDTSEALDLTSVLPSSSVSTERKVKSSMNSFKNQHKRIFDFQPLHLFDSQPVPNTRLDSSHTAASDPSQFLVDFSSIHPSEPEYSNMGTLHQEPQNTQAGTHSQMCSNYEYQCRSPCSFNSQHAISGNTVEVSQAPLVDAYCSDSPRDADENYLIINCSRSSDLSTTESPSPENSAIKSPMQSLAAVLGHGSPVTTSVLKQGLNLLKCGHEKPLQVLVPRSKLAAQATNKRHMAKNMMSLSLPCHGKAHHEHGALDGKDPLEIVSVQCQRTSLSVKPDVSSSISTTDEPLFHNVSYPSTMSQCTAEYSPISVPEHNHNVFSFAENATTQNPTCLNNQSIRADGYMPLIIGGQIQTDLPTNTGHGYCSSFRKMGDTKQCQQRKSDQSYRSSCGGSESEPILRSNYSTTPGTCHPKSNEEKKSLNINLKCMSQHQSHPLTQRTFTGQNIHHSVDSQDVLSIYPSQQATVHYTASEKNVSHKITTDQPCKMYLSNESKQQVTNREMINDVADVNQTQLEENGHMSNMILRLPKACFASGFLDSPDMVNRTIGSSLGHSVPSSIDSGHVEANDGSLQSSNHSQLGLLKPSCKTQRQCEYFSRDVPDYKYLCIVATLMNPVFGLVALICNHFAQRNLRLQRRTHANNLYFATIAISTVAIFLTLIAAALFIAHNIVLQHEKIHSSPIISAQSCEGRFFGYDDSLKNFFGLDIELYCEITKNEKIMEALKRFWLEDSHIKKKLSKQRSNSSEEETQLTAPTDGSNSTGDGFRDIQIGDRDVLGENMLSNWTFPDMINSEKVQSSPKNSTANSSLAKSIKGPIIPPGLEGEYERYLDGQERTKVKKSGRSTLQTILSRDIVSDSAAWNRSAESTTVSNVYELANNTTEDAVESLVGFGHEGT